MACPMVPHAGARVEITGSCVELPFLLLNNVLCKVQEPLLNSVRGDSKFGNLASNRTKDPGSWGFCQMGETCRFPDSGLRRVSRQAEL